MKLDYRFLFNLKKSTEYLHETVSGGNLPNERSFVDFMLFTAETESALRSNGYDTYTSEVINARTSSYETTENNSRLFKKKELFEMWTPLEQGGLVTVPWTVQNGLNETIIEDAINQLKSVLGCFDFPKVKISERKTTKYVNGLMFKKTSSACYSVIGRAPRGSGIKDEDKVPKSWQEIALNDACSKDNHSIQHEILHALGKFHEMQRQDRDDYITINDYDEIYQNDNWKKIPNGEQLNSKMNFTYNPRSLMHYSPTTAAKLKNKIKHINEKLVHVNQDDFQGKICKGSGRITTEDALQLQELYCLTNVDRYGRKLFRYFVVNDTTTCSLPDEFDVKRKIFPSRLCDGIADCANGEDELTQYDGGMCDCPKCKRTNDNCCSNIVVSFYNDKYPFQCTINENSTQWDCPYNIHLALVGTKWKLIFNSNTTIQEWPEISSKKCPPLYKKGKKDSCIELSCKLIDPYYSKTIIKMNHCGKDSSKCHKNASCKSFYDKSECVCNDGFEGDGQNCAFVPEVNECLTGTHDCKNAHCRDTRYSYECDCKDGYIKEDQNSLVERSCINRRTNEICNMPDGPLKRQSMLLFGREP